ncbi:MAG: TOBE domain-containing protein, partial [Spirochaetota bacterium]
TGAVSEIFQEPCSSFAADFVGMRNIFPATFHGSIAKSGGLDIELARPMSDTSGHIAIRPENIVLSKEQFNSSMRNSFKGNVLSIIDIGFFYEIDIKVSNLIFRSVIAKGSLYELQITENSTIYISFKATAIHNF